MDGTHFDALTRTLWMTGSRHGARRGLLLGALGLLGWREVEEAAAHNPLKKCKKKSGKQKKKCLKKAKAHNAQHAAETPPPTGCPAGTRTCADGRCVPAGGCCTNSECAPGTCDANGTCNCPAPFEACPGAPGACACCNGERHCPERNACIPPGQCCTAADCGAPPEVGATCGSDGTCACGPPGPGNPFRVCEETPGICSLCCADSECPTGTTCVNGACRCPSGGCDCEAATTLPTSFAGLIGCGQGIRCICYIDMEDTDTAQCGVFEFGTCSGCTSADICLPNEFCGLCLQPGALQGTCTARCAAG